jgi:hypothetical protein
VRQLREGVGTIRQALEIAVVRVKEHHMVKDEPGPSTNSPSEH